MDLLRDFWEELNGYRMGYEHLEMSIVTDNYVQRQEHEIIMENGNHVEIFFYILKKINRQVLYIKMTRKDGQKFTYDFDSAQEQNYFWEEVFDDGSKE